MPQVCAAPPATDRQERPPVTLVGCTSSSGLPVPSWPSAFEPQQLSELPLMAQLCAPPTASVLALDTGVMRDGLGSSSVLPLPTWPESLQPQQSSAAPCRRQVWQAPAASRVSGTGPASGPFS